MRASRQHLARAAAAPPSRPASVRTFVWLEVARHVPRWRFWLLVVVMAAAGTFNALDARAASNLTLRAAGTFSFAGAEPFQGLAALTGAVVAGASLAEDRRRGYHPLVLARGFTRRRYLAAKAVAAFLVAALAVLVASGIALAVFALVLPWGSTEVPFAAVGPAPDLFETRPALHDALVALLMAGAAGAFAMVSTAVGAAVANEYLAIAVPFVAVLVALAVPAGPLELLVPYTYLDLSWGYLRAFGPTWRAVAAPIYWVVVGGGALAVGSWLTTRKEWE